MPSPKKRKSRRRKYTARSHPVFWPLVGLAFILWVIYRSQLQLPIWFDEIIGKAIFFGLPVWLYMNMVGGDLIYKSLAPAKLEPGLLLGIAIGGLYGFAGAIGALLVSQTPIQPVPLFLAPAFWWQFFLILMTAFWESIFFFSWIQSVIEDKLFTSSLVMQVSLTAVVFVVFHLPNTILRYPDLISIGWQVVLLALFAVGQAFIFSRWKNVYTLIVSHAVWAMVLFVHLSPLY